MAVDNKYLPDASSKEKKLHTVVGVTFGLLCVLQAALNISLRLAFYSSDRETPGVEAICKNLTEERDELKSNRTDFDMRTQDFEARIKDLIDEQDKLNKKLNDFIRYSQLRWTYFGSSFYYISSSKKTWEYSRYYCRQRGADLMIINSREEQSFTRRLKDNLWIGLTDREMEGTWKWVDGTPLNTSYWINGEPNSYEQREEDCAEVRYHKMENSWNDKPCLEPSFWICEKKMFP